MTPYPVTSSSGGISCGNTCTANFTSGNSITLTALPDANASFTGWSGAGCTGTGPCTFTPTVAETVTATFTTTATGPIVTTPAPNSILTGPTETFTWAANGTSVTGWWIHVGTDEGLFDLYDSGSLGTTTTAVVSGLPINGSAIHVRLWYLSNGWQSVDYQYTASGGGSAMQWPNVPNILFAKMESEQNMPATAQPTHGIHGSHRIAHVSSVETRQGGGVFSLRFGVPSLTQAPSNPFVHLVADGDATSTTITPAPGTVLSGSTVTFSWGYSGGGSSGTNVPYRYTGKEQDDSTGLYFYEARYYDPVLGRFISADTIVPDPENPQEFNRYTYVLNNPLKLVDPTGNYSSGCFSCGGRSNDIIDNEFSYDGTFNDTGFNYFSINQFSNTPFVVSGGQNSISRENIFSDVGRANVLTRQQFIDRLVQPVDIFVGAFAPYDDFGFAGDGINRVHSADPKASFRTLGRTRINTLTGKILEKATGTSGTKCASALCRRAFGNEARFANVINISHSQNDILTMFVSGTNPMGRVGGRNFAPGLDLQLRLNLTNLTGTLMGDQFPSVDVFAQDAVGNKTLLHSFDPQADRNFGPYYLLLGLGTRPMGDF